MKPLVFVRRGSLVDWCNVFVIRFVLSLFVFRRFAPGLLSVHRFLQRSRGVVTKYVKLSWTWEPGDYRKKNEINLANSDVGSLKHKSKAHPEREA